MSAAVLSWQEIAHALTSRSRQSAKVDRPRQRGRRVIPQETIRAIRADAAAEMPRAKIAIKYRVSEKYLAGIIDGGLRDDEREKLK